MDPITYLTSNILLITLICSVPLIYILIFNITRIFLTACLPEQGRTQLSETPQGCRRLGLPFGKSNIADEFDPKYSQATSPDGSDENGLPNWRIKALFAYPIKSCAGVEFDVADVVGTGVKFDRMFCFAEYMVPSGSSSKNVGGGGGGGGGGGDEEDAIGQWEFRTMRNARFTKLALVRPEIWVPDPSSPDYEHDLDEVKSGGVLVIRYPNPNKKKRMSFMRRVATAALGLDSIQEDERDEASFTVPLQPPPDHSYPSVPVKIWKDVPVAFDYSRHLPASFRKFLSGDSNASSPQPPPLTLVRVDPAHYRQIFRCAPRKSELGFQPHTGFADAYPLHLLNLASVQDIGRRCTYAIPKLSVRRFRANVIVQGPGGYEEDAWKRVLLGPTASKKEEGKEEEKEVEIYTVCRTVRCRLPNVDPDTGLRHPAEPDKTLKSFRCIDRGDPKNACLGMQAVPSVQELTMRVGQRITVLETGDHFYIKMMAPDDPPV